MIVRSIPSATANTPWALGAAWYIGAVMIVLMPGRRPIPASVAVATLVDWSGVIALRITPFATPVVPDV
jgi:hypothetical protein